MKPHLSQKIKWINPANIPEKQYTCGYCGSFVASNQGFVTNPPIFSIAICPYCQCPTFFFASQQIPEALPGKTVEGVPEDVNSLYTEARRCIAASAYTASVLACRKLLMHIAVSLGDQPGKSFMSYVEFLADKGYVPPNGKAWVNHIRKKGNEANHEIVIMSKQDAEELITFLEMLLRFIYEFPSKIPQENTR